MKKIYYLLALLLIPIVFAANQKCYIFGNGQVCLNTTAISSPSGTINFNSSGGGTSDGNNYTYAQEINQSGNTYTLYTYRNGISVPLTSSFTVTPSNGSGGSNVSFVNALNGYPLKMNGTSDVTIFNVSCDYFNGGSNSGYGFIDINNNSGCGLFLKSEIDGSITNEIQNLWATINGNTGSTTASTSTDTLTIQGSGGTHVSIAGDTVTISSNVSLGGGGNLTSIANNGYILYQKNGTIINGTVIFYNESTGQIILPAGGLTLPTITANDVDTGISINGSEVFISVNGAQKAKINANGIALNDGTLSAYAYAFQSDVNVGMRLIRSDNIGIGTGGTDALDINNTIVEVNRNMTVRGDMNITSITYAQDIVPRSNNTYDLGSSSRYWRDLYLSNSTIYMNGWTIRSDANYLYYNGASLMTVAYGINSFLNISDQRYNETTLINNVINNVTSINQSKADLSYVYRVESSLNFTNTTTNSLTTSIGYLNTSIGEAGKNATSANFTATEATESIAYINSSLIGINITKVEVNSSGSTETINVYKDNVLALTASWTDDTGNGTSSGGGNTSGMGVAGQLAYFSDNSNVTSNANVTIDSTNGNVVLNSEADVKYLRFDNVSAPSQPTSEDRVILYGSNKTGQPGVWYTSNASAQPYRLMPMIDMSYMTYCYAQASTVLTCIGTTTTLSGTSTGTVTQDDINTFGRIFYLNTSAGTQSASALAAASSQVYTKNGVDFATTFCFPQSSYGSGSTGTIFWLGFSSMSTKNLTAQDTPANQNAFGFAYSTNASNTNFMLRTQTATSETETDTGVPFTAGDCYYGAVYGEKNGDALYYYMRDLNTTVEGYGYTKSNLPTSTSALVWNVAIKTLSANARYVGVKNWRLYYRP